MSKFLVPSLLGRRFVSSSSPSMISHLDPVQVELLNEPCIVVDENDVAVGKETKKDCHLFVEPNPRGILHRAFSVFLFNSKRQLLLQKRSLTKVTFPGHFTNTCCSHPLYVPEELELEPRAVGVRRAAQRRLQNELGIPRNQMPLDGFQYLTRIHYCSASGSSEWGENEIDYILVAQRDVEVTPNPDEIEEVVYVGRSEMPHFLDKLNQDNVPVTPWFRLICDHFLYQWWDHLNDLGSFEDHATIHRL